MLNTIRILLWIEFRIADQVMHPPVGDLIDDQKNTLDHPQKGNAARWSEQQAGVKILRTAAPSAQADEAARRLQYGSPGPPADDYGQAGGLGVSISMDETGYPVIVDLEAGGAAAQSGGVFPGDVVYAVNGRQFFRVGAQSVLDGLAGDPGTSVELLLDSADESRGASQRLRHVTVARAKHARQDDTSDRRHAKEGTNGVASKSLTNPQREITALQPLAATVPSTSILPGPPPQKLKENLESFYSIHSPAKLPRVGELVADYAKRGATTDEYKALNDELKGKYGSDLSCVRSPRLGPRAHHQTTLSAARVQPPLPPVAHVTYPAHVWGSHGSATSASSGFWQHVPTITAKPSIPHQPLQYLQSARAFSVVDDSPQSAYGHRNQEYARFDQPFKSSLLPASQQHTRSITSNPPKSASLQQTQQPIRSILHDPHNAATVQHNIPSTHSFNAQSSAANSKAHPKPVQTSNTSQNHTRPENTSSQTHTFELPKAGSAPAPMTSFQNGTPPPRAAGAQNDRKAPGVVSASLSQDGQTHASVSQDQKSSSSLPATSSKDWQTSNSAPNSARTHILDSESKADTKDNTSLASSWGDPHWGLAPPPGAGAHGMGDATVVELNVGGQVFATTRGTLSKVCVCTWLAHICGVVGQLACSYSLARISLHVKNFFEVQHAQFIVHLHAHAYTHTHTCTKRAPTLITLKCTKACTHV